MYLKKSNKNFIPVITVMLAMLAAISPFAIDTYLAAMPTMADVFGVNISVIEITLTVYYLGFAAGNFLGGPLSDSFGRKKIALSGVFLYVVSALAITQCVYIETVFLFRALQAFGGGFATVSTMAFVRDWFEGKQVARLATVITMIMMLAPLFAPVIGTALLALNGWEMIFYFLAIFAFVVFVSFLFLVPESRERSFITNRITTRQLMAKYRLFFANRNAVLILFSISFSMAGMFTFITSASFVYLEFFDVKPSLFPLIFGANVVLNVILSILNTYLLRKRDPEAILKFGLVLQLIAGLVLVLAVQATLPSFVLVFGGVVLFIGSLGLIFGNGTAIVLNMFPEISGSANATIGVTRFIISSMASFVIAFFHTGNLKIVGAVMFCCTFLANGFFYLLRRRQTSSL
jgi:DHA1 family bicyclomycin/chloramphenicol resistance-like MFS transporter